MPLLNTGLPPFRESDNTMNLAILWEYVRERWRQLRSVLTILVLQCCMLSTWLLIGFLTYHALTRFVSGDIRLGMLCVAGDVLLILLYGALMNVRSQTSRQAPGKHAAEPAEEQQDELANNEEDDSASWQTEAEYASSVVDNSIDYDADTRDGANEIVQSVEELRAADENALMDELRKNGLLSGSLSPEATRLTSAELRAFRRLTEGL